MWEDPRDAEDDEAVAKEEGSVVEAVIGVEEGPGAKAMEASGEVASEATTAEVPAAAEVPTAGEAAPTGVAAAMAHARRAGGQRERQQDREAESRRPMH